MDVCLALDGRAELVWSIDGGSDFADFSYPLRNIALKEVVRQSHSGVRNMRSTGTNPAEE